MIDRRDQDCRMSVDERIATATSQLERNAISVDVFRATLFGCGKREDEIEQLVRLHRPAQPLAEISRPIISAFVSGLS